MRQIWTNVSFAECVFLSKKTNKSFSELLKIVSWKGKQQELQIWSYNLIASGFQTRPPLCLRPKQGEVMVVSVMSAKGSCRLDAWTSDGHHETQTRLLFWPASPSRAATQSLSGCINWSGSIQKESSHWWKDSAQGKGPAMQNCAHAPNMERKKIEGRRGMCVPWQIWKMAS